MCRINITDRTHPDYRWLIEETLQSKDLKYGFDFANWLCILLNDFPLSAFKQ